MKLLLHAFWRPIILRMHISSYTQNAHLDNYASPQLTSFVIVKSSLHLVIYSHSDVYSVLYCATPAFV